VATRPRAAEDISAVRRSMHPADCIPAGGEGFGRSDREGAGQAASRADDVAAPDTASL
jgi:hypothetical protein